MITPASSRRRKSRWSAAVAVGLSLVIGTASLVVAASPEPRPSPAASPTSREVPVPINVGAIVGIDVTGFTRRRSPFTKQGYGVVVDPAGLILAPANLVAPNAPGVAITHMAWNLPARVDEITVRIAPAAGQALSDEYTGRVLAVDGWLDIAVVGLDPAPTVPLVAVSLSSAPPVVDQQVVVVDTSASAPAPAPISAAAWSAGVLDLGNDPRVESGPGWLTTDQLMPFALPAVLITDTAGLLVALSTFLPGNPPFLAEGRPVALLQPVLDAARSGATYTTPYVVPGTGEEQLQLDSWVTTPDDPCDAQDPGRVATYASGAPFIKALFAGSGFTEGEDVVRVWWDPVERLLIAFGSFRWQGGPDACVWLWLGNGGPLPDGAYALDVHAGGILRRISSQRTKVGGSVEPGSITISGRMIDSDTGAPIEGGLVIVLEPGVDPQTWSNEPNDDEVASSGFSDQNGRYETQPPIALGTYPFIIWAFGYQTIGGTLNLTQSGMLRDIALTPLE